MPPTPSPVPHNSPSFKIKRPMLFIDNIWGEGNIAWLSLNFILSTSWVALYSEWVRCQASVSPNQISTFSNTYMHESPILTLYQLKSHAQYTWSSIEYFLQPLTLTWYGMIKLVQYNQISIQLWSSQKQPKNGCSPAQVYAAIPRAKAGMCIPYFGGSFSKLQRIC